MTKKIFLTTFIFVLIISSFIFHQNVLAQNSNLEYTVLAPLPCINGSASGADCSQVQTKTTLEKYLPGMFRLLIGIAGVFAVLIIVVGGFQYMTTDSLQGKQDGKQRVYNAVKGLVLVIAAWLILYTVNPALLELKLEIAPVSVEPAEAGELAPGSTSADYQCPTGQCIPIPGGIAITASGRSINQVMAPKLTQLNESLKKSNLTLTVTEAYPPSRHHQSPCHTNGTCIDARRVSDKDIYTFIKSSQSAGLRAEFEVETPERKSAIINSCPDQACKDFLSSGRNILVLPPKNGKRQITGEHFSVYNN